MTSLSPTPHRVGKLFEVLAEQGEDMHFRLVLTKPGERTPVAEHRTHHKDADGYGAIARFLGSRAARFEGPAPRAEERPPALRRRVTALLDVLRAKGASALTWTRRDPAWRPGSRVQRHAEAGELLSLARTSAIREAAKRNGVSVSALLLHTLNRSVTPNVADAPDGASWGLPVNMRGPVRVEPELANASSIVPIAIAPGDSVAAVDRTIRGALENNLHWGKWDQVNLMIRFGERATRRKIEQYYRAADPARVGVFSNVGVWSTDEDAELGMIGFGPPTLVDPLFAGAITLNGKLGLSLRAHPSVTSDDGEVRRWLDGWLAAIDAITREEHAAT